jgi:hypothetical protein
MASHCKLSFHGPFMAYLQNRFSLTLLSAWLLFALAPTMVTQPLGAMQLKPLMPPTTHDSAVPRRPSQNKRQIGVRRRSFHIYRLQRVIAVLAVLFHGGAWLLILCRDRLIRKYLSNSEMTAAQVGNYQVIDHADKTECVIPFEPPDRTLFDFAPKPLTSVTPDTAHA